MSQIKLPSSGGGGSPVEQFTTDDGSEAIPVAGNINIFGAQTAENNDDGIQTTADPSSLIPTRPLDAGDTVYIALTNRQTGTTTTNDDTLTTVITFAPDSGGSPATFYISGNVVALCTTNGSGGAYSFTGGYVSDGAVITEIGVEYHDQFEELVLEASDIFLTTDGTNILVQVMGIDLLEINWNALLTFRQVT